MYLLSLSPRDPSSPHTKRSFEKTCRSVSWRVWCPIDIALWVVVFLVLAVLLWKLYKKKTKQDSHGESLAASQVSQNADLPGQDGVSIKNNDNRTEHPCGLSQNPQRIVNHGSVITSLDAPRHLPTPTPALLLADFPSSGHVTGLGITFGSTSSLDLRFAQMPGFSRPGSSSSTGLRYLPPSVIMAGSAETGSISTPPPAYVRDDKVC